jgi:hypothetical protein
MKPLYGAESATAMESLIPEDIEQLPQTPPIADLSHRAGYFPAEQQIDVS